jgi:hypothetical protein
MSDNPVVTVTRDAIYWDGAYSRCHVGKAIETYLRESIQRIPVPATVIFPKSDGFIGLKHAESEEINQSVLPSETLYMHLESLRRPATYPIVAALCSRGMERSNLLYLPLDDETFQVGLEKVLEPIPQPAWEDRKPIAYWRGGASGCGFERPNVRVRVTTALYGYPGTDVRITPWWGWENGHNIPPYMFAPRSELDEHFQHKYLLIIDGNCIASNHQWVFGSGSVPIMVTHPDNRYWFQKYLKPMVNYVPIKYDLSDLKEKIDWLREHDAEAKRIAENAGAFSRVVFSPAFQRRYIDDSLASIVIGNPSELFYKYIGKCLTPSDINEHLQTLYTYASRCTSVVECGVRDVVSSYAFASALRGTPDHTYMMIDPYMSNQISPFLEMCAKEGVNASFLMASDTECDPLETDMLFIDTWHVYAQLKRELAHWHSHVHKYIVMHDTTVDEIHGESIRMRLDTAAQSRESGYPEEEIRMGLGSAIAEFLGTHPEWVVEKKYTHNNGLTVLARR